MPPLPADDLPALISRVRTGDGEAWASFLRRFAPLLLQAARSVERDSDAAADAFTFACERLRERSGARLAGFDFDRPGRFETWLHAVALNLCRDARRRRLGRFRPLAAIRRLPLLEQRVFRVRYEQGLSFDQTLSLLASEFPGLTETRLAEADSRVSGQVSSRQRWSFLARRPQLEPIDVLSAPECGEDIGSSSPDPEWLAITHETHDRLKLAMATLTPADRLLIRLRYDQGLTLARVATMAGFRDVQTADRRIRELLRRLRAMLDGDV